MQAQIIKTRKNGFSLIELSIVLIVIGVLVSISINLGADQINFTNIKSTQNKLNRIDQALATYLKMNNALPCPADGVAAIGNIGVAGALTTIAGAKTVTGISTAIPTTVTAAAHGFSNGNRVYITGTNATDVNNQNFTVANATTNTFQLAGFTRSTSSTGSGGTVGLSYSNASCASHASSPPGYNLPSGSPNYYVGIIPVRALNLSDDYALDAWGNRITYVVSKHCADPNNWSSKNIHKCTDGTGSVNADGGNITIKDLSGTNGANKVTDAAYAILSLGKDGYGAYSKGGVKAASEPGTYTKETYNSSATYSSAIFNDGFINDGNQPSSYFDDIVHWKTGALIWNDAHPASPILPACLKGQSAFSDGAGGYYCGYTGIQGKTYTPFVVDALINPTATLYTSDYPLAKYMIIEANCSASAGTTTPPVPYNNGNTEIYLYGPNNNGYMDIIPCETNNYNGNGGRVDTKRTMVLPVFANSKLFLQTGTTNLNGSTKLTVTFLY